MTMSPGSLPIIGILSAKMNKSPITMMMAPNITSIFPRGCKEKFSTAKWLQFFD